MLPASPLRADGDRVWVASVAESDVVPYGRAVEQSAQRIGYWNPVDPRDLLVHLERQSDSHRTVIIHARRPSGTHDIVGKVNVSNVVRGRFMSATMGYDAYDPYAGTGLFAEGMRLVIGLAFAAQPAGMGLRRLEANVQPANTRSAGLLRSLGFRRERHIRHMLWLEGGGRPPSWRDHDSYALTMGETALPYRSNEHSRVVVVVDVRDGGRTARSVAQELGLPVLSSEILSMPQIWSVLADSVGGAVLHLDVDVISADVMRAGLVEVGVDPDRVMRVTTPAVDQASAVRLALRARATALG
ncbi:GNAT family N-acetyltransferase [Yimella sp. cx-573]|nr:GNAT family N-acetyltransferase [Yimella sp. cx-573]